MVSENRRPTRHDQHETSGLATPVLRSVVLRMNDAFPKLYEKWDVKGCMRKNWSLLFERLDTDKSGRLDYEEYKSALADVLEIPIRSKDSKCRFWHIDSKDIAQWAGFPFFCGKLVCAWWSAGRLRALLAA